MSSLYLRLSKMIPNLAILGLGFFVLAGCQGSETDEKRKAVPADANAVFSSLPAPESWMALPGLDWQDVPNWVKWQETAGLAPDASALAVRLAFRQPVWLLIGECSDTFSVQSQTTTTYRGTPVFALADSLYLARPGGNIYLLSDRALAVEKGIYAWHEAKTVLSLPAAVSSADTWCFTSKNNLPDMVWRRDSVSDPSLQSLIGHSGTEPAVPYTPWSSLGPILPADLNQLRLLPVSHPFAGGWEAKFAGETFYLLPAGHARIQGLDVFARQAYLQFVIRDLMGLPIGELEDGCRAVTIGNWDLVAADADLLQQLISRHVGGVSLQQQSEVKKLLAGIPEPHSVLTYHRTYRGHKLVVRAGNQYYSRLLSTKDKLSVSVLAEYEHPRPLLRLDTCGQFLAVQDDQFRLVMLDQHLQPRWSLALADTLLGVWEIPPTTKQVSDRILIQTSRGISLIDSDGQLIRENIWSQPGSARCQGTLVQFEERGTSWLFVPLSTGRTYAVNPDGALLHGWEEGIPLAVSSFPLQHYTGENGSVLFGLEQNRDLWALNRSGRRVFPTIKGDTTAASPIRIGYLNGALRLVWLQDNGRLRIVNDRGDTFLLRAGEGVPRDFFLLGDEYVLLFDRQLIRANYAGNSFGVRSRTPLVTDCDRLYVDQTSGKVVGCWSARKSRLHLLHADRGSESLPFDRAPVLREAFENTDVVGISDRTVRLYRLPE